MGICLHDAGAPVNHCMRLQSAADFMMKRGKSAGISLSTFTTYVHEFSRDLQHGLGCFPER